MQGCLPAQAGQYCWRFPPRYTPPAAGYAGELFSPRCRRSLNGVIQRIPDQNRNILRRDIIQGSGNDGVETYPHVFSRSKLAVDDRI